MMRCSARQEQWVQRLHINPAALLGEMTVVSLSRWKIGATQRRTRWKGGAV